MTDPYRTAAEVDEEPQARKEPELTVTGLLIEVYEWRERAFKAEAELARRGASNSSRDKLLEAIEAVKKAQSGVLGVMGVCVDSLKVRELKDAYATACEHERELLKQLAELEKES